MRKTEAPFTTRRRWLAGSLLPLLAGSLAFGPGQRARAVPLASVKVLAASDLQFALARIASRYQEQSGQSIAVVFGSSGNMARQIQQGLAADIFMSADESLVQQLARAGLTRNGASGDLYALGRLALQLAIGVPIEADTRLSGVRTGWQHIAKFAIANPEHAPYGRAAREALQALDLWTLVQPRLVLGDNIAQATQFVTTGAAQAGITALSLVLAPELKGQGRFMALPAHLHNPLRQRMVLLQSANAQAMAFYAYLQQAPARALLAEYGFVAPP